MVQLPRFAVFASGRGSNARVLFERFTDGFIPGRGVVLITDQPDAKALEVAEQFGIPGHVVPRHGLTRTEHDRAILQVLQTHQPDHILLAGYLRILSPMFIDAFPGYILNIHPSLLPEFPGLRAAERQAEAGRTVVGATVHFVDHGVDTGPILLQQSTVRDPSESPTAFAARMRAEVEHELYPRAVRLFVERLQAGFLAPQRR